MLERDLEVTEPNPAVAGEEKCLILVPHGSVPLPGPPLLGGFHELSCQDNGRILPERGAKTVGPRQVPSDHPELELLLSLLLFLSPPLWTTLWTVEMLATQGPISDEAENGGSSGFSQFTASFCTFLL